MEYLLSIFMTIVASSALFPTAHSQTQQVYLPTTDIYFQCGNTTDPSLDFDGIDWEGPIKSHYLSVLIDATSINLTDAIDAEWRPCADLPTRQFRISVAGVAEYEEPTEVSPASAESTPTSVDVALLLSEHSNDLKAALSATCFGEDLVSYKSRSMAIVGGGPADPNAGGFTNQLGEASWSTQICLAERALDQPTSTSEDESSSVTPLFIVALVIGIVILICGVCCLFFCFGDLSCIFGD